MDEMTRTFSRYATSTIQRLAHEATGRAGCEALVALAESILATRAARPAAIEVRLDTIREGWEAHELAKVTRMIEAQRRRAQR